MSTSNPLVDALTAAVSTSAGNDLNALLAKALGINELDKQEDDHQNTQAPIALNDDSALVRIITGNTTK